MRALISTHDKTGLDRLGLWLMDHGVEILATGGTARSLREAGVTVSETADATGFGSLLEGRVKTLHPALHAAILARPTPSDLDELERAHIAPIDLLVVNLYPFRDTWRRGASVPELIEQIDIGGVALLRAGAKNFDRVSVLAHPAQYAEAMAMDPELWDRDLRLKWAAYAFRLVAAYDADIAEALTTWEGNRLPERLTITGDRWGELRYGENPHQNAGFYVGSSRGLADAAIIQGKPLSYNNLADADTAWRLAFDLTPCAAVAVKHQTPCGVAYGETPEQAFMAAREADSTSIFGGIIAFNRPVDERAAHALVSLFLEVVIAPDFTAEALPVLAKKPNLRVLKLGAPEPGGLEWRSVSGGFLVQDRDQSRIPSRQWKQVAGPPVEQPNWADAELAWTVVRYVKSNAVCLVKDGVTVGIGSGQTNRVDAVRQALDRAGDRARGAVLASDAFFFADTVEELGRVQVGGALSPGGSLRDQEVRQTADRFRIPLWFTGERHFRH